MPFGRQVSSAQMEERYMTLICYPPDMWCGIAYELVKSSFHSTRISRLGFEPPASESALKPNPKRVVLAWLCS